MKKIYVLTLWEPWATLFVYDVKKFETRPKPTSHKGTYLIHAARRMDKFQKDICQTEPFASALASIGIKDYKDFKPGAIVGSYEHEYCAQMQSAYNKKVFFETPGIVIIPDSRVVFPKEKEIAFGDWREGRYVWAGSDKKVFKNPIMYKNGQGYYQPLRPSVDIATLI